MVTGESRLMNGTTTSTIAWCAKRPARHPASGPIGNRITSYNVCYTKLLREKWLLICQKTPESWRFDHTERIRNDAPAKFQSLKGLLDCCGPIRFKQFTTESVVEITTQYMREKMHLATVRKTPPLVAPPELEHRRYLV